MIDTDKYEGHKPAPWVWDICGVGQYESLRCNELEDYSDEIKRRIASKIGAYDVPTAELMADAPLLLEEVKRLHKNKSNLFTTIEQKLNEKGDEGEAIWEANPNGHYKEDELRGWCEALEFVLGRMNAQEEE